MEKTSRLSVLALALGICGCAGDDSVAPAPGSASAPGPSSPVVNKVQTPSGRPDSNAASASGAGAPARDDSGKVDAPSLEGPRTDTTQTDGSPVKLTAAETAKIKTLPAAEQELALKQAVCPVSGEHLGTMGTPVKVTAEGRTFYLCCKNCEDEVKSNPKAVIAKLNQK
jgi:YHS domain-containing protein